MAIRLREPEAHRRSDGRVLLVLEGLLECGRRFLPALDADLVHRLLIELTGELVARLLDGVREDRLLGLGEGLVLDQLPLVDEIGALALTNEIVELRRAGLGGGALAVPLVQVAQLAL